MSWEGKASLTAWIRRLFCRHEHAQTIRTIDEWDDGIIVGIEARTWTAPVEITRCPCGWHRKRRIGPAKYVGWT